MTVAEIAPRALVHMTGRAPVVTSSHVCGAMQFEPLSCRASLWYQWQTTCVRHALNTPFVTSTRTCLCAKFACCCASLDALNGCVCAGGM